MSSSPDQTRILTQRRRGGSSRIVPPRRSGRLCERRELLVSLDESLNTRVTLIVAPAGYGKTTLLAQWCQRLDAQQIPVAYYAASERERDPAAFLIMMASALHEAGVEAAENLSVYDDKMRDEITLDDILLSLELSGQEMVLIIDDFERVSDSAVTDVLTSFIDAAPSAVHLVIASRTFPAVPLSALELEGKLRLIDTYQLRFRRDELAWLLELETEAPELADIAACTQGWPVTAELYRLWRERHLAYDSRATFGGHVAEVHNYLTEQLFSSLPAEQFDLLVDIADQDEVSADLVDAMRERADSARLLRAVSRNISSLMWTGQENEGIVYRLHPLLLDHLRQTLEQDVARRARLAVNAALWFFEHQRFPDAVRMAIESKDEETIAHIIQHLRPVHILSSESAATLRMILRELPDDLIARYPRLQIMAAIAHFKAGFFIESRNMLEQVREATDGFTVDPGGRPDWLSIEGYMMDLIFMCQVSRPSNRVEELRDIVMKAGADDPTIWGACEIVMMLICQIRGDLDAADAAVRRSREIYSTVELSRYSHTQIVGHEALILLARGQLRHVADLIANYQKLADFDALDDISTPTLLRLLLDAVRYEREYSESAVEALKEDLAEHSKAESWSDQYAIAYPPIATRLFLREGAAAARAYIESAQARAQQTGIEALPDLLTFMEIECDVRADDIADAERKAERVGLKACAFEKDALAQMRGWRERDGALLALARLQMAQARPKDALTSAQRLTEASRGVGRLRSEIKGLLFCALAHSALGAVDEARADFLKALLLAYPEGFVAPFAEEGEDFLKLVDGLNLDDDVDAFAKRHLDEIRRAIDSAAAQPAHDELNAREQEVVRYLIEGLSNKVIARRMGITHHTVKFHLKKVFSKLKVSSRRAAVAKVLAEKLDR